MGRYEDKVGREGAGVMEVTRMEGKVGRERRRREGKVKRERRRMDGTGGREGEKENDGQKEGREWGGKGQKGENE